MDTAATYDAEIVAETSDPSETALATVAHAQHSREEIEAFKSTVKSANKDMTDAQFTVFMAAANHLGLDPLARQVVPILMSGRMTVQTTIDGFRLIAERTGKYRGQIGPFWCGKDGVWHDVWLSDDAPVAAKVGIKRSDFDEPMWGICRVKSYAKGGLWVTMPDVMSAKVAESVGMRKTFPNELSGAYTREELDQAVDADPTQQPHYAASQQASRHQSQSAHTRSATRQPTAQPAAQPAEATISVSDDTGLPTWGALGNEASKLGLDVNEWQQTITAMTGKARTNDATGRIVTLAAQLTDDDKRTMLSWLANRRRQFEAADAATPPLETLAYAGN